MKEKTKYIESTVKEPLKNLHSRRRKRHVKRKNNTPWRYCKLIEEKSKQLSQPHRPRVSEGYREIRTHEGIEETIRTRHLPKEGTVTAISARLLL